MHVREWVVTFRLWLWEKLIPLDILHDPKMSKRIINISKIYMLILVDHYAVLGITSWEARKQIFATFDELLLMRAHIQRQERGRS